MKLLLSKLLQKIDAFAKLPITKKYTFPYLLYRCIEKFFILSNRYFPIYRLVVEPIEQNKLSRLKKDDIYYIPISFFSVRKKKGISGVARLKNGDDFLYDALESYLPIVDELILVDNNSTDKTVDICLDFEKKYPSKVKFYRYEPHVDGIGSGILHSSTSIHSLAYYYNRCFSKTTYSHVMKIDDDNIAIQSQYEKLVHKVLREDKNGLYATRGLNIFEKDGIIGVLGIYPYPGKYGDHGIYKVTPKTYYIQNSDVESMTNPHRWLSHEFAFIHLKALKKNYGYSNRIDIDNRKKMSNDLIHSDVLPLDDFLSGKLLEETNVILQKVTHR